MPGLRRQTQQRTCSGLGLRLGLGLGFGIGLGSGLGLVAATHAVRAELLVLQVLEALERLAPLQSLGDRLRQREAVLGAALDGTGVAVEDAQQAADGKEGLQVNGQQEEPPPAAVGYDGAVAEGAKVRGQHAHERDA